MKKKLILVAALFIFMSLTLIACAADTPSVTTPPPDPTPTATPDPTPTATPDPTPEPTPEPQLYRCADGWKTETAEAFNFLVCLPAMWQSYEVDTGDPNSHLRIFGEGADGSIEMMISVSPLTLSTLYYGFEQSDTDYEPFLFDDGSIGYMTEYTTAIHWFHVKEGFGILSIGLWHDGNREIFADNEDLILRIVRSVRRY